MIAVMKHQCESEESGLRSGSLDILLARDQKERMHGKSKGQGMCGQEGAGLGQGRLGQG
eukprot:CAMPEP_0119383772 /NCGR_PEP_ID=MMETSP1334-20130426/81693_1 /TAXON_ID=127549 /ORGANISM="Calcidiscus leptoporus, Strain RCC1130" /LENGTH=58 /DNA_ID=CAMNT_0007404657 /DNA_START=265 /DNA_END=438 /DNA_ORIENTATION=+